MKLFLNTVMVFLGLNLLVFFGNAQQTIPDKQNNSDSIYVYANQMPEFPGGMIGLKRYIAQNIIYPKAARESGIEGRIFCRFVVNKDGSIGPVEVIKKVHPLLDNEAIRVLKSLPKFKPAESNGKPVRVWYSIPITFDIPNLNNENRKLPEFPGGNDKIMKYFTEHFMYPANLRNPNAYGTMDIEYEITKTGEIGKVKVVKKIHPLLDKEAVRVIKSFPKFKPGEKNGVPADMVFELPVVFEEPIFDYTKRKPKFLHLKKNIYQYISENLIYPEEALYAGKTGTVKVKFELTKNGKIDKINILSGDYIFRNEAMRLVKNLPELEPVKVKGKFINVWYQSDINFKNKSVKVQRAKYPEGDKKIYSFLDEKFKPFIKNKEDSDYLYLVFQVKKDGKIGKIKILKGINKRIDSIALNVISSLPDFIPGKVNNKIADTWYPLSLDFRKQTFIYVRKMPEFPGGITALKRYIAENVEYPKTARSKGIQGTIFIRFEVTETGKVGKIEIQKGVHPLLDNAAIKVVKSSPDFIPGEQNGVKVSVWYSIPVTFKLN